MKDMQFLLQMLAHLNAACILTLCGWLALTASNTVSVARNPAPVTYEEDQCDCRLVEVLPGTHPGLVAYSPPVISTDK